MTRIRPSDAVDIRHGDALDVLRGLPDESVEAFITDPPYGLSEEPDMAEVLTHWLAGDDYQHRGGGFMGATWDSFVPGPAVWREAYRVLKPGGHLLCFAGTRTSDLMGIAIRLAGFEIRDRIRCETTGVVLPAELAFTYGQGFPKSLDVSKAIDKMGGRVPWSGFAPMFAEAVGAAGLTYADVDRHLGMAAPGASSCYWARTDHRGGLPPRKYWDALQRLLNLPPEAGKVYDEAEREIIAIERRFNEPSGIVNVGQGERSQVDRKIGSPSSDAAKRWSGYGTALKPAYEPIIVARKPLVSTVAANVLTYGTGALNIAATRVGTEPAFTARRGGKSVGGLLNDTDGERITSGGSGRWPSNVVLVHVGTAAYTLRHDAPEAVYAYYRDLEEVREVPEPHRRDALGVGEAAVLREGMLERGGQGPAQGADGDDDMHRLPEDVRGVPGMGPERAQEVLLEGVSLEGASPAGSDGQAAYPGGASEDGGNPDARGAVVAVEGRPIQVPGVRLRDGGPAAAGDAGARAADDEQDVRAGASSGSGEDGRTAADAGRRGASRQRGEGGQPAGEPDGDRPSRPLNGAPRDRTQVQGVAGRGGEAAGGERRLAVPPSLIPPAWLRYFDGVVEIPGCVPVGTRKVRNPSGSVRGDEPSAVVDAVYAERERVPFTAHGDADGTETVEAWECVEGCPVAEMDAQSGASKSPGTYTRSTVVENHVFGASNARPVQNGHGDEGGASRFFPTFKYQAKADGSERPVYIGPVCFSDSGCSQVTDEMHPSVWPEWARDPKGVCPECGTPCGPIMHPTVKPLELARWLIRLVVAKGGTFIDPFVGSGTFAEAAILEGVNAIVVDKVGAHIPLIEQRVTKYDNPHAMAAAQRGEKVATRAKARKVVTDDEDDLFAGWAS